MVLESLVGQVVQALQYQQLEHKDATDRLAPGLALALLVVNAFKDRSEDFPVDNGIESLQRVTSSTQTGVAVLKVK